MPVTVVLLSAGYATRLYPLTKHQPKALLPLGQGVILDAVMRSLDGVPEVAKRILVTNHSFAEQFHQWRTARGADVEILDDGTQTAETRLGAIRDLELARTRGGAVGDLLVLGTDNLFGWPLTEFVTRAQRYRPESSIGLWELPSKASASQFGVAALDRDNRITAFVEKSPNPPSATVALCLYYFPASMVGEIQRFIEEGGNPDAPGYFLEWLVRQRPVYGVLMQGMWYDIGTLEAYQAVVKEWPR